MKTQQPVLGVHEIKQRMEALSTFLTGTISIPLGVLWLGLGAVDFFYIVERNSFFAEPIYNRLLTLFLLMVQAALLGSFFLGTVLVGAALFLHYRRKLGAWLPYFGMPKRYWALAAVLSFVIAALLIVHYVFQPVFPWLGLSIGVLYSVGGAFGKPRRGYYPAVSLPLMALSFLPLLIGADGLWTRAVCFLTYGLTQVFLGWLDHRNLMRLHRSLPEVTDGTAV